VAEPRAYNLKRDLPGTMLATPISPSTTGGLAFPSAFLVRIGVRTGFHRYELPALGGAVVLIAGYFAGTPTGSARR